MRNKGVRPGLVDIDTEHLRTLLRGVHRGTLECPLTPVGLACHGLQEPANMLLAHLRGLDRSAVHAVLVAVLAERQSQEKD